MAMFPKAYLNDAIKCGTRAGVHINMAVSNHNLNLQFLTYLATTRFLDNYGSLVQRANNYRFMMSVKPLCYERFSQSEYISIHAKRLRELKEVAQAIMETGGDEYFSHVHADTLGKLGYTGNTKTGYTRACQMKGLEHFAWLNDVQDERTAREITETKLEHAQFNMFKCMEAVHGVAPEQRMNADQFWSLFGKEMTNHDEFAKNHFPELPDPTKEESSEDDQDEDHDEDDDEDDDDGADDDNQDTPGRGGKGKGKLSLLQRRDQEEARDADATQSPGIKMQSDDEAEEEKEASVQEPPEPKKPEADIDLVSDDDDTKLHGNGSGKASLPSMDEAVSGLVQLSTTEPRRKPRTKTTRNTVKEKFLSGKPLPFGLKGGRSGPKDPPVAPVEDSTPVEPTDSGPEHVAETRPGQQDAGTDQVGKDSGNDGNGDGGTGGGEPASAPDEVSSDVRYVWNSDVRYVWNPAYSHFGPVNLDRLHEYYIPVPEAATLTAQDDHVGHELVREMNQVLQDDSLSYIPSSQSSEQEKKDEADLHTMQVFDNTYSDRMAEQLADAGEQRKRKQDSANPRSTVLLQSSDEEVKDNDSDGDKKPAAKENPKKKPRTDSSSK